MFAVFPTALATVTTSLNGIYVRSLSDCISHRNNFVERIYVRSLSDCISHRNNFVERIYVRSLSDCISHRNNFVERIYVRSLSDCISHRNNFVERWLKKILPTEALRLCRQYENTLKCSINNLIIRFNI